MEVFGRKKAFRAFTLIELLVVIAIIALLLAIIMPALGKVKKQAMGIVCLSNIRGLTEAWYTYMTDNHDVLVSGHVPSPGLRDSGVNYWVENPQDDAGNYKGGQNEVTLEYEQNGIRKGALFPYLETVDVYNCPANKSDKLFKNESGTKPWFNGYSITGLMNGEVGLKINSKTEQAKYLVQRGSQIERSSEKVVFIENADPRGWVMGSWLVDFLGATPEWNDLIAIWHGDRGSLGFADGHAEMHHWVDNSTIENAEAGSVKEKGESGEDLAYMTRAYVPGHR